VRAVLQRTEVTQQQLGSSVRHHEQRQRQHQRQLLQNQAPQWPRETASISSTMAIITDLANGKNSAEDGLKVIARSSELARLASNKQSSPSDYDRPKPPAPAKPSRNPFGRRRLQQQQPGAWQQLAGEPAPPPHALAEALADAIA
jgi:hypothetical protein